jgi:hypothetical protein
MTTIKDHDQILLRVARGGQLDRVLRPMFTSGEFSTEEVILEQMGRKDKGAARYHVKLLDKWFDNVTVQQGTDDDWLVHYTDVKPTRINAVSDKIELRVDAMSANGAQQAQPTSELGEEPVVWPDVPPQIHPHPNFIEPKWFKTMRAMVNAGRHIRLPGPPSVGKDTAIKQLAYESGKPLVTLNGSSLRERHMTGIRAQDASGRSYFLPSQFAAAVVYGWWANITEVNAADQDVLLYLNSITEEPFMIILNGRAYPVHKDFRLFVSYNPGALGTRPLPASLADRFFPIKLDFHTEATLRKVLEANGMPESDLMNVGNGDMRDWTACLVKYIRDLYTMHEQGHIKYQVTVRRGMDCVELMKAQRTTGMDDFRDAVRASIIGAIDNPLDANKAEALLRSITC